MKSFLKSFLASLLAVIAGSGCVVFFVFAGLIGLIGSLTTLSSNFYNGSTTPQPLERNTILKVDVAQISDVVQTNPFDSFTLSKGTTAISLSEAVRTIALAKNNPDISALYLNVENIGAGMASVDELRRAIQDFKKSRKPVIAYADNYSQKAYYLSSVADKIYLNPIGTIELIGIASGEMMYKDALDKLGIKMEVFKVGTFKSAVEPYILNHISDANKLQKQEYIDGLWSSIIGGIAAERKIALDALNAEVNGGIAFADAESYLKAKLVDGLTYRTSVDSLIASTLKVKQEDLKMQTLAQLSTHLTNDTSSKGGHIEIVFAEGDITEASSSVFSTGENTINASLGDKLNALADDDYVDAVVLRINSPGGSAFLSEQLWYAVKNVKSKKPIVVSMGDYAASGGYYIASAATRIVAEPNTLTGSIGIFGLFPNFSDLVKKVGVNMDVVKTNEFADLNVSMNYKPLTPEQRALIQRHVERGYDTFLSRVAEGRRMTKEQVDSIGQGRVWLGKKAYALGLVDTLGGLQTAIDEAARLAELTDYSVDYGTTKKNLFDELLQSQNPSNEFIARLRNAFLTADERKAIRLVNGVTQYSGIQARLPYDFVAY